MMKAAATSNDGRTVLIIGLSHANLDKLREGGPEQGGIVIEANGDWPVKVMILGAPAEADFVQMFADAGLVDERTKVIIDDKLKS